MYGKCLANTLSLAIEYGFVFVNFVKFLFYLFKKPIGARCRKIPDYVVKASSLTFSGRQELCFSNLNDMECYKNPTSPGKFLFDTGNGNINK